MSNKRPTSYATHDNGGPENERSLEPAKDDPRSTTCADRSTTHEDRAAIDADADALALARVHADELREPDYDNHAGLFPHEKLDVYRVALEMAALAKELADEIPRGHRNVADHLIRAAEDTVLLCAEGTNRRGAALKRQRFVESRGEVGEVAAAADLIIVLRLGNAPRALKMKQLANRVSAMLTRMIARVESESLKSK